MGFCMRHWPSDCKFNRKQFSNVQAFKLFAYREAPLLEKRLGDGCSVRRNLLRKYTLINGILSDINLPLSGISFTLVLFFLRVRTPEGSIISKVKRVDWL